MAPEINTKSMKNRRCVADAFLKCFVAPNPHRIISFRDLFWSHFSQKSENRVQKSINNGCRKSVDKLCQKVPNMMPKWMPTSLILHVFPGQGLGLGFSLSDAALLLYPTMLRGGRRINLVDKNSDYGAWEAQFSRNSSI